ncbi:MAG: CoA transferase [Blastococcus sp.]|nr:CoA transferase [Blastococcus sp.]
MSAGQLGADGSRAAAGMLEGLRLIELATVITGPYAGMLLADLGAQVIKVEPPAGDGFRGWDGSEGTTVRPAFAAYNRGKRSIALDLKHDAGRRVLMALVAEADAVVENFRPGVADRLGIGYEDLRAVNERIVYCSITGMGAEGPERLRPTYDAVAQGMSGLWSQLTDLDDPEPVGPPMADQLTGMYAALGILAGVTEARRTGAGRHLEISMLASCVAFQGLGVATFRDSGVVPGKGTRARTSQSYAFVAGDGRPFTVHLSTPQKFWAGLCAAAGRPELLDDPRFATKTDRIRHYDELRAELGVRFATHPRAYWLDRLAECDVPAAPILDVAEMSEHPQVLVTGIIDPARAGRHATAPVRSPVRTAGAHAVASLPAPELSEHAEEILSDIGIDPTELQRLRSEHVIV